MKRLTPTRFAAVTLALLAVVLLAVAAGLALGPSSLSLGEVATVLSGGDAGGPATDIVLRIRLPRVLLALVVGAALATSGVVFQALLRNPLADPYVLGISGGAALAGIAVLALGASVGLGASAVPPAAFGGSVLATLALHAIAGGRGRVSSTNLLLTGVVFNAFASAAIVFLASISGFAEGARIFLWLIGNLGVAGGEATGGVALLLFLGLGVAMVFSRSLNLLALGDESAEQLGVPVEAHKRWLLAATSLMVGAAVSVAGLVGFVGLIIPHLLRIAIGPDHRLLVPSAALAGAAFLVLCDTAARVVLGGRELPVGAITAIVGGPLFLVLLRRHQGQVFTS